MKRINLIASVGVMAASGAAIAQPRYNIDFGGPASAPAPAYGAASGQMGCWSLVNAGALTNLTNPGTCAATIDTISGTGGINAAFNHPVRAATTSASWTTG